MLFTGFKFVFGNIFLIFNFISSFYFCYIRHFCYTICSEVVIVDFETVGLFSNQRHCIYFYLDHLLEITTPPNHLHHLDTTQSVLEASLRVHICKHCATSVTGLGTQVTISDWQLYHYVFTFSVTNWHLTKN